MNVSGVMIGLLGIVLVVTGLMLSYFKRRSNRAEIDLIEEKNAREADGLKQALDKLRKEAKDAEERYREITGRKPPTQ